MPFQRQFLRRKDARHRLKCPAVIECRGVIHRIEVVDFSFSGLRIDGVVGLVSGDHVLITLTPQLAVEGTIVWSVWHKAGVKLSRPMAENDPLYMFLVDQAAQVEHARTKAILALAKQHAGKQRQLDTD
jgi:hypothetical protein